MLNSIKTKLRRLPRSHLTIAGLAALALIFSVNTFAFEWNRQYPVDVAYVGQGFGQAATNEIKLTPGQTGTAYLDLRNSGIQDWTSTGPNPLRLGTDRPRDRKSKIATPAWLAPNRPGSFTYRHDRNANGSIKLTPATVIKPGETARFVFPVQVPAGYHGKEYFQPVQEGRFWLGRNFGIYWNVDSIPAPPATPTPTPTTSPVATPSTKPPPPPTPSPKPSPTPNTPPAVTWQAPTGGTVSGQLNEANGNCRAAASDPDGIDRIEFFLDGAPLNTEVNSPYTCNWNTLQAANGSSHILKAVAYDAKGASATSQISVTINNPTPTPIPALPSPSPSPSLKASPSLSPTVKPSPSPTPLPVDTQGPAVNLLAPTAGVVAGNVALSAAATDPSGVGKVEFYVDGALVASDTSSPYAGTWNSAAALPGAHTVTAKAIDTKGNSSSASTVVTTELVIPPPTSGTVLFRSTFENNFSDWYVQSIPSRATILSSGAFQGSKAARFEVRDGDVEPDTGSERSEVSGPTFDDGQELYVRDAIRIPDGVSYSGPWQIIQQLHDDPWSGSPGIAVFLRDTPTLTVGAGDGSPTYWNSATLQKNQWYDLVYRVKLSQNASVGFVEVWLNGVPQTLTNGQKRMFGQTIQAAHTYLKAGIYRGKDSTGTSLIDHDNIVVGTTLESVMGGTLTPTSRKIFGTNNTVGWGGIEEARSELGVNGDRVCHDETNLDNNLVKLAAQGMYFSMCVNSDEGLTSLNGHAADYANTTAELARKYGPGGTYWATRPQYAGYAVETFELMNEPYGWWYREGDNDPAAFARIAAAAIKAGKAANPQAKFYVPLAPGDVKLKNGSWVNWNQELLKAEPGLFQLADGFSIHLYYTPSEFASVLDTTKSWAWSQTGGNGKPFIITEANLTDQQASPEANYVNAMPQFVKIADDRSWVKELFIFSWHGFSGRDYLGFLNTAGDPRQARIDAYRNAIQQALGTPTPTPNPAPSPVPVGTLVGGTGFENGLTGWNTAGVGDVIPTVVGDTVKSGSRSARFILTGGQNRSELILGGNGGGSTDGTIELGEGAEGTYAFSFLAKSVTYGRPGAHNLITQFKGNDSGSPNFGLQLWDYAGDDGKSGGKGLWSHGEASDGDRFLRPIPLDQWQDIVVQFKISGTGNGYYRTYLNGQLIDSRDNVSLLPAGAQHIYFKNGIYRNGTTIPGTTETRVDDVKLYVK